MANINHGEIVWLPLMDRIRHRKYRDYLRDMAEIKAKSASVLIRREQIGTK